MSTKNLARTAIEGGRTGYNKWDRRYSHKIDRARQKAYLKEVKDDLENYYEYDMEGSEHVQKEFSDKLGPMYRWLDRQVGLPWDEVRSKVIQEFDTRTTAGRHIVYDHLLRSVEITPDVWKFKYYTNVIDNDSSHYKNDFYVSEDGYLRKRKYIPRGKSNIPRFDTNQIANWLNGKVVGKVGNHFYWFEPANKTQKRGGQNYKWKTEWEDNRKYYYRRKRLTFYYLNYVAVWDKDKLKIINHVPEWTVGNPTFRQYRKLNEKELAFWNTIPEHYQKEILERSPTWDGPPPKKDYWWY